MTRLRAASVHPRQRSYWLRCFLGNAFLAFLLGCLLSRPALANVNVSKTLYVQSVHGQVTDDSGRPIEGAKISLKSGEKSVADTISDSVGIFRMKVPGGSYWLSVNARGFVTGGGELRAGPGFRSFFHSDMLYVVLTVGAPDCPPVATTSRREFKHQVHVYENLLGERK